MGVMERSTPSIFTLALSVACACAWMMRRDKRGRPMQPAAPPLPMVVEGDQPFARVTQWPASDLCVAQASPSKVTLFDTIAQPQQANHHVKVLVVVVSMLLLPSF